MSKSTGGPAFPEQQGADVHGEKYSISPGMTLRDYFAAKAMAEILARWGSHQDVAHHSIAKIAYQMADAMLSERAP